MKKAIITVGVSASGKSTWAREVCAKSHDTIEINRDAIRATVLHEKTGKGFSWSGWKWKWEDDVTDIQQESIAEASVDSAISNIIISDTNLSSKRNQALESYLKKMGFEVEFKFFEVSYEEAVKRDAGRCNGVGSPIIAKQFQDLHILLDTHIKQDPKLKPVILVDIDGTLAHMNRNRSPFEWDKVYTDEVDEFIRDAVNLFSSVYGIIVLSGRDGICYEQTRAWLDSKKIFYDDLLMRSPGDMRSDDVVKREIVENKIISKYFVKAVIDDRPKVCRMWRKIGFKTLQVGDPHVEF